MFCSTNLCQIDVCDNASHNEMKKKGDKEIFITVTLTYDPFVFTIWYTFHRKTRETFLAQKYFYIK